MEKCIGCELCAGVCPARCIYVAAPTTRRRPGVARRALRLRLRDQLPALHPLRPVRRGLPHRGHHRVEAVRVLLHQPQRRHLHEGRAAGRRRRPAPAAALGGLAAGRRRAHLGLDAGHRALRRRRLRGQVAWSGELGLRREPPSRARRSPRADRGRGRRRRRRSRRRWTATGATTDGAFVFLVAGGVHGGPSASSLNRNPVHAALSLVATLFGIAVLFVAQEAHFLAAVQVIVYAGAIVVLFLFVIMLLGVDQAEDLSIEPLGGQRRPRPWPSDRPCSPCRPGGSWRPTAIHRRPQSVDRQALDEDGPNVAPARPSRCSPTTCSPSRSPRCCS